MKRKIKLSFEEIEKEFEVLDILELNNSLGGNGVTGSLASQFYGYGSSLDSKINSLTNKPNLSISEAEYLSELVDMRNEYQTVLDLSNSTNISFNSATSMSGSLESTTEIGSLGASVTIGIKTNGQIDSTKFAHEIKHIYQAANGQLGVGIGSNATGGGEYDKGDEMEAYRREEILKHGASFFDKTEYLYNGVWQEMPDGQGGFSWQQTDNVVMTPEQYVMSKYRHMVDTNDFYKNLPDGNLYTPTQYPTTPYDGDYPTTPYDGDYPTTPYEESF